MKIIEKTRIVIKWKFKFDYHHLFSMYIRNIIMYYILDGMLWKEL